MKEKGGFARWLQELRKKANLIQPELAELVGVSLITLKRWETGVISPRIEEVKKLCEILGCTETELLNGPQDDKIELVISWSWKDMEKGEINMNENKFKLILGDDGKVGLQGAGLVIDKATLNDFLERIRVQLEVALDAQIKRGVIQPTIQGA